jgi:hypothetical protein
VKSLDEMKLTFGDVLGERLFLLEPTIIRLQHDWPVYRSLFGANEQRWDFLHKAGGSAMFSIENALWDRIILSLCRLTDLDSNNGSKRVTLHQLSPRDFSYKDPKCGSHKKSGQRSCKRHQTNSKNPRSADRPPKPRCRTRGNFHRQGISRSY